MRDEPGKGARRTVIGTRSTRDACRSRTGWAARPGLSIAAACTAAMSARVTGSRRSLAISSKSPGRVPSGGDGRISRNTRRRKADVKLVALLRWTCTAKVGSSSGLRVHLSGRASGNSTIRLTHARHAQERAELTDPLCSPGHAIPRSTSKQSPPFPGSMYGEDRPSACPLRAKLAVLSTLSTTGTGSPRSTACPTAARLCAPPPARLDQLARTTQTIHPPGGRTRRSRPPPGATFSRRCLQLPTPRGTARSVARANRPDCIRKSGRGP